MMTTTLGNFKQTVDRMKMEILEDVGAGKVPVNCLSFAALHDHVDANKYGGFCDDEHLDKLIEHFGGRDDDEGMPDAMMRFTNGAQHAVHVWLKANGIETGCPPAGWDFVDLTADDAHDRLGIKPYWSVFETQMGGNGFPTYDLTVLQEGKQFFAAHGGVLMPERVASAKEAAGIALAWYVENGLVAGQNVPVEYLAVENVSLPPPTLHVDNPGGEWLKTKQQYVVEDGLNRFGTPATFGPVTGCFDRNVMLPVSLLKTLPGLRNEQNNIRQTDLASLITLGRETGKFPESGHADGSTYNPFVQVDMNGKPWVNEGNHRILAASELGWDFVPVELRYFDGGEGVDGPLSPSKVANFDREAIQAGRTPTVYGDSPALLSRELARAGCVSEGMFSGRVTEIADGIVVQRINREGDTVWHDVSKLSAAVKVGDLMDVQYQGGDGMLAIKGQSAGVER